MNKNIIFTALFALLGLLACEPIELDNDFVPGSGQIINKGADLQEALHRGYATWWSSLHSPEPAIALGVAADAYGLPWDNFGADRMGHEPRMAYQNFVSADPGYRSIVEQPWYGCLRAVADANDILRAMSAGITIDEDGPQDQSVRAAAHALRGLSWGYLSLMFDQAPLVREATKLGEPLAFSPYPEVNEAALLELEAAREAAAAADLEFIHTYFNGLVLGDEAFKELCHAYSARFIVQLARTPLENEATDWAAVKAHARQGLSFDFAPTADGQSWAAYQRFTVSEVGEGPFWARLDQRLVAAFDPSQPARYPEVSARSEPPLANPQAQSDDQRLSTDFLFQAAVFFPAERGEWHYSHYQHHRHVTQPGFMGDGRSGPMPTFLAADNQLLLLEASMRSGQLTEAAILLNQGTRATRGQLPLLGPSAGYEEVEAAIVHERAIELYNTAPMGPWFDRRRLRPREQYDEVTPLGGLQWGTPAQLPVPAEELRINGMPVYSFGGEKGPEGTERVYY